MIPEKGLAVEIKPRQFLQKFILKWYVHMSTLSHIANYVLTMAKNTSTNRTY